MTPAKDPKQNLGAGRCLGDIWKTSGRHLKDLGDICETLGRHLEDMWETSGGLKLI